MDHVQPFLPRGTETPKFKSTFTNMIENNARGIGGTNEDFVSLVENMTGEKMGSPKVREAINNLTKNEQAQVAAKTDALNKIDEANNTSQNAIEKSKNNMDQKRSANDTIQNEADRKAKTKANVIKALKWIGIPASVLATEELYRHF